jgi:hypothetical protein
MAVQIVMDPTGDTRHEFNATDSVAVAKAERRFSPFSHETFPPRRYPEPHACRFALRRKGLSMRHPCLASTAETISLAKRLLTEGNNRPAGHDEAPQLFCRAVGGRFGATPAKLARVGLGYVEGARIRRTGFGYVELQFRSPFGSFSNQRNSNLS